MATDKSDRNRLLENAATGIRMLGLKNEGR
jgi:hypothetical protein